MKKTIASLLVIVIFAIASTNCPAATKSPDITGDGIVDFNDFALFASQWFNSSNRIPEEEWINYYYDGNTPSDDYVYDIIADNFGNIYSTGVSLGDYLTIKYDSTGNQLWTARYNATGNGNDIPLALAQDGFGNIYVTGQSQGVGTKYDYATVKYDANGNQLWFARYNGTWNGDDYAQALSTDNIGNVYVTGFTINLNTGRQATTIKYDPNGNQIWISKFSDFQVVQYSKNSIAVDTSYNSYVGCTTYDSQSQKNKYTVIKYDPNGNQLWFRRYELWVNNSSILASMVIDVNANVYITGQSYRPPSYYDFTTIKYDTNGNQLWKAFYNGPANSDDIPCDLIVDETGNVYVTGYSVGIESIYDFATVKYDPNGNELWIERYDGLIHGSDSASSLVIDNSGNVYVAGHSADNSVNGHYVIVKYDLNGNQLWTEQYENESGVYENGCNLVKDGYDNIYLACNISDSVGRSDYATIKYNCEGEQIWDKTYGDIIGIGGFIESLAMDNFGNIYVTGQRECFDIEPCYKTIKYDMNGVQLWGAEFGGKSIAADISGNVYVTGYEREYDYVTVKYDSDGNELWTAVYNGDANGPDYVCSVAPDYNENIFVTGMSAGIDTGDDYATVKYDSNGNELWVRRYNGTRNGYDRAYDMALDKSGNVYVTGSSSNSGTYADYTTIKYDPNGNQLWIAIYNGPANTDDVARCIILDEFGNIYVAGASSGIGTNSDFATVKYDVNGNQLWVARYNRGGSSSEVAESIVLDALGNVYVSGFGSNNNKDYVTVKYDANGTQQWVARYNGTANSDDYASCSGIDKNGNVYVSGSSIGIGTAYDWATVKYDPNGNQIWAIRHDGGWYESPDHVNGIAVDDYGNVVAAGGSNGYCTIKYAQDLICQTNYDGDLDGDCKVDMTDLALFVQQWMDYP